MVGFDLGECRSDSSGIVLGCLQLRTDSLAGAFCIPQSHGIRISMDGKGCWRDNVFVERLWRTIKYEHVYLHAYESVSEARQLLSRYITFYNPAPALVA